MIRAAGFRRTYDVSPIDNRFLLIHLAEADAVSEAVVRVVLDWHEELERIAGDL